MDLRLEKLKDIVLGQVVHIVSRHDCFLPSTSQPLKMWPSLAALVSWPGSLNTRQASDLAHNHELGSHVWLQLLPVNQKHI